MRKFCLTRETEGFLREILLCSNTPGALYDVGEILLNTGCFEVLDFEKGLDAATAAVRLATPDLFIVNIGDFESNSYVSLLQLQAELPRLPVLVYGSTLEYTEFNAMYMGNNPPQLEKPVEPKKVIDTVCRALDMSDDEANNIKEILRSKGKLDKPHVLVVDDNAIFLRTLKTILQADYRVTLAKSGEGAIRAIEREKPDMVLLDYDMPEMDGCEVIKKIRENEETEGLKVVFLTGISDREHISSVMKFNPNGYLLKPINNKTLLSAIEATLAE